MLEPGACMLVFSDGISDEWHSQDTAEHHLVDLATKRTRGDVMTLRASIFNSVAQANDDRTLIIVERLMEVTAQTPHRPRGGRTLSAPEGGCAPGPSTGQARSNDSSLPVPNSVGRI